MAVRIRLARRGRKKKPIYSIVVADSRAPRDGKFIEKLGLYNPNIHPAEISLNGDRALHWLMVGAQPSHTARFLLSRKGIMFKKHLQVGVNKGAITQETADQRFQEWVDKHGDDVVKEKILAKKAEEEEKLRAKARAEAEAKRKAEEEAKKAAEAEQKAKEEEEKKKAEEEAQAAASESTEAESKENTSAESESSSESVATEASEQKTEELSNSKKEESKGNVEETEKEERAE